jgi:hypothetical protein
MVNLIVSGLIRRWAISASGFPLNQNISLFFSLTLLATKVLTILLFSALMNLTDSFLTLSYHPPSIAPRLLRSAVPCLLHNS